MADLTPQAFVEKWKRSKLSGRSTSQQHFLDLCRMGQPTPADIDPEGTFYTFEKNIRKSGGTPEEAAGGKGFADVGASYKNGRIELYGSGAPRR